MSFKRLRWIYILLALFGLQGCAHSSHTSKSRDLSTMEPKLLLPSEHFAAEHWQQSSLIYTPSDWPEALSAEVIHPNPRIAGLPVMLLVHGGGWQRRSAEDMRPLARYWAQRGFITVNIAYRFAPEHRFPAQLQDVQQAMHWIHQQADVWQADPERILAMGFSSGAHLVALMALVADQGGALDQPYGGPQTRPYLVVAGGIPSDLRKWDEGRLVEDFLGGKRIQVPEAYHLASPQVHVHAEAPPFFLFHGRMDRLVPPDHAEDFYQALAQAGVEAELFWQPWRGHVTSFLWRDSAMQGLSRFLADQGVRPLEKIY